MLSLESYYYKNGAPDSLFQVRRTLHSPYAMPHPFFIIHNALTKIERCTKGVFSNLKIPHPLIYLASLKNQQMLPWHTNIIFHIILYCPLFHPKSVIQHMAKHFTRFNIYFPRQFHHPPRNSIQMPLLKILRSFFIPIKHIVTNTNESRS